ncbi:hypothetical protein GCM10027089_27840 [Nocardia thraciensis]
MEWITAAADAAALSHRARHTSGARARPARPHDDHARADRPGALRTRCRATEPTRGGRGSLGGEAENRAEIPISRGRLGKTSGRHCTTARFVATRGAAPHPGSRRGLATGPETPPARPPRRRPGQPPARR